VMLHVAQIPLDSEPATNILLVSYVEDGEKCDRRL